MAGATNKRDLRTGRSVWADSPGLGVPAQPLKAAVSVDVAVVGAGISGAFVARELAKDHSVAVLERPTVAEFYQRAFGTDLPESAARVKVA